MTTSSFSLSNPKRMFQEGALVLELTDIHLDVTNVAAGSDSHTDKQIEQLDLGIIRVPIGLPAVMLMVRYCSQGLRFRWHQ